MNFTKIITAIDTHTEGNPDRVVTGGIPPIPGKTMLEKSKYARDHMDYLRTMLMHEPCGHSNMYAALLVQPTVDKADIGVLYLEPGGYATMCGHGTIAICTVLIDCINSIEFCAPASHPKATLKNAVVVPPAGMDRPPCGTGTCAKMATLYTKGQLHLNEEFVYESIIGTLFFGRLIEETKIGEYPAVVPTIRGSAYITGIHQFVVDARDPFPGGFHLGKIEKLYGFGFRRRLI